MFVHLPRKSHTTLGSQNESPHPQESGTSNWSVDQQGQSWVSLCEPLPLHMACFPRCHGLGPLPRLHSGLEKQPSKQGNTWAGTVASSVASQGTAKPSVPDGCQGLSFSTSISTFTSTFIHPHLSLPLPPSPSSSSPPAYWREPATPSYPH